MKKCPYCAEEIQDEAKFCIHCRKSLEPKAQWVMYIYGLGALVGIPLPFLLVLGVIEIFSGQSFWLNWGLQWFLVGIIIEFSIFGFAALLGLIFGKGN